MLARFSCFSSSNTLMQPILPLILSVHLSLFLSGAKMKYGSAPQFPHVNRPCCPTTQRNIVLISSPWCDPAYNVVIKHVYALIDGKHIVCRWTLILVVYSLMLPVYPWYLLFSPLYQFHCVVYSVLAIAISLHCISRGNRLPRRKKKEEVLDPLKWISVSISRSLEDVLRLSFHPPKWKICEKCVCEAAEILLRKLVEASSSCLISLSWRQMMNLAT